MLYQLFETQRALMSPFSEFAGATAKLYSHPLSPFFHAPMSQKLSAGLDLMQRLAKEYEKPEFGIRGVEVDGVEVAVQELVAITKPFCRLLRFKRYTDDLAVLTKMKDQPTVLVVAPLSGHHSTLLRDTVKQLLKDHKVYITDWTDARMVPLAEGPFHLDDYIEYVQDFIRHIGANECHVISVCQPTVPVLAAISLMASKGETTPLSMTRSSPTCTMAAIGVTTPKNTSITWTSAVAKIDPSAIDTTDAIDTFATTEPEVSFAAAASEGVTPTPLAVTATPLATSEPFPPPPTLPFPSPDALADAPALAAQAVPVVRAASAPVVLPAPRPVTPASLPNAPTGMSTSARVRSGPSQAARVTTPLLRLPPGLPTSREALSPPPRSDETYLRKLISDRK